METGLERELREEYYLQAMKASPKPQNPQNSHTLAAVSNPQPCSGGGGRWDPKSQTIKTLNPKTLNHV
jgi:hypothetical protein